MDRHAPRLQLTLERLVLQRGPHRQPSAASVGLGGQRQRGAAELVVLDRRRVRVLVDDRPHAHHAAAFAIDQRLCAERTALVGVELDQATDRARSARHQGELAGEPVIGDHAVGVGARNQATTLAEAEQPLASEVHAVTARAANAP